MKVLIACEFSEIVKEAFLKRGHDAHSCDFLPGEKGLRNHWQVDLMDLLRRSSYRFELMIAFPPCTHLAVSGARWFKDRQKQQMEAIDFFLTLSHSTIPKVAIENPIGIMSTKWRKPDQIIQPWQFGHTETKATCLWLKGLPLLQPTKLVQPLFHSVHREPPGPNRWKNRSRTFQGIADAMAEQWGNNK